MSRQSTPSPQNRQLSLIELPEPAVLDARFRLSDHTRRLGLVNVARARLILAQAAAAAERQPQHRAA
jgi:hypothetical protein